MPHVASCSACASQESSLGIRHVANNGGRQSLQSPSCWIGTCKPARETCVLSPQAQLPNMKGLKIACIGAGYVGGKIHQPARLSVEHPPVTVSRGSAS